MPQLYNNFNGHLLKANNILVPECNFKGKEANLRLLTRATTVFNGDPDADVKAAEIAFDDKIDALKIQFDGNPPSTEV